MDPNGARLNNPASQTSRQPESTPLNTSLTDAVREAWGSRCASLGEEERLKFESHACNGLEDYLKALEAACQGHKKEHYGLRILDWFEPIFKAIDLFTPAAAAAIQAYPNPGSLVLGGIVGILQTTSRVIQYQKLTLQMLARMGRKAYILLEFEKDLYKDDYPVQRTLILVYGDIIAFCQKAFKFLTDKGQLRAKIRGLGLTVFRDYESHLGKEVQDFEQHLDDLEARACLCDRRRLKELREGQEAHNKEFGQALVETREHSQLHSEILANLLKREQELRERTERQERERDKQRLLDWLSPLSFNALYEERCENHLEGTGSWFLGSQAYQKWKSSPESDLLWIKGKPGCGKSFLATIAVADLKLEVGPETGLAYAFCRKQDESSQDPSTIMGALAKQIGHGQSDINSVLKSQFEASERGEKASEKTVRLVMDSVLSQFRETFLVIDALDECKNNHQLARGLVDLMKDTANSPVKIVVFSRPDYELETCFKPYSQIQPDLGANEDDLKAYIEWLFPDDEDREIREQCVTKANGMFLWVKLLELNLRKPLNSGQKLKRIKDIPSDLRSMYDRMLSDIWEQDGDVRSNAFLLLMWVTHARRPLTRFEMLGAVADYNQASNLKEASQNNYKNPELLVMICANLVFIDKDGYFRLCHESVRDYLDSAGPELISQPLANYQQQKQHAHHRLAEICLKYLLLKDFDCGPAKSVRGLVSLVHKYPFLEYAANFWGSHVAHGTLPLLHDLSVRLVLSQPRRELSMQMFLYDPSEDDSELWTWTGSSNPLHALAMFGLRQTAEALPDAVKLSQEADASGSTPLTYALIGQHHEMSLWLIEHGRSMQGQLLDSKGRVSAIHLGAGLGWADVLNRLISQDQASVNSKMGQDGRTPLVRACKAGEKQAVITLLDKGADINLKDGSGDTPLIIATFNRHTHLAELLLERGAEPECRDEDGITPLHYAALNDDVAIVKALLAMNADPLVPWSEADGQTPFHVAAEVQALEVIRALHRVCPGLNTKSGRGHTPLHIASWYNSYKSADVLLGLGILKDEVDNDNTTALFIAAQEGALETVKVLVAAGCDVAIPASDGRTAIHAAASSGKLSVLRHILNSQPIKNWKALVNKPADNDETPIHAAIDSGKTDIVRFLLKAGADGTINGILQSSPLHYAAHYGHRTMCRLILSYTKDVNPRNRDGDTPLHFAARARKFGFITQLFRDASELGLTIDVEALNEFKKTALMAALEQGCENVAKFLVDKTSVSTPDRSGNYHIHLAAWHGLDSVVESLLTHDGVQCKGYQGRTPLACAARRGQLTIVKLLASLSEGTLNQPDDTQATPVLSALSARHTDVANYLLDLGADHTLADEHGNTMLHIAAEIGDLPMAKRLLQMGCSGDVKTRYGDTPFHRAIQGESAEIVAELLMTNPTADQISGSLGDSCIMLAAQLGNMEILQMLDVHGAQYGACNLLGRTAAYAAATNGHWEVLDFLTERGENLERADLEGNVALGSAASNGYPDTVKYLLKEAAHTLGNYTSDRESPLSAAARNIHPSTIKLLLAAGADPYHRDNTGLNALAYATCHPPTLSEMHKAQHFYNPESLGLQEQILTDTIRDCCERLLQVPQEPSAIDLYHRLSRVISLSKALRRLGDYDAAKICYMELLWPIKFSLLRADYSCDICGSKDFIGDKYLCKSCHRLPVLCESCHKDYKSAGDKAPEALEEIVRLEKLVQPVRAATSERLELLDVYQAVYYFKAGSEWVLKTLDAYEVWEQKFNSSSKYRELERPGQDFLKMVKKADQFLSKACRDGVVDDDDRKGFSTLNQEYKTHRRKHRADKEIVDFTCTKHEFFLVSDDEREQAKTADITLDHESGRVTAAYLERVLKTYSRRSGAQADDFAQFSKDCTRNSLQESVSAKRVTTYDRETTGWFVAKSDEHRPRSLKRSFTALGNTVSPSKDDNKMSFLAVDSTKAARVPFIRSRTASSPRRAETLPILSTSVIGGTYLQRSSMAVDVQDTRVIAAVQAHLDPDTGVRPSAPPITDSSQSTITKTINVSFTAASGGIEDGPVALVRATSTVDIPHAAPPSSVEDQMLSLKLTLSDEPETISENEGEDEAVVVPDARDGQASEVIVGAQELAAGSDDEANQAVEGLRIAYRMMHDENESDEDVLAWVLALNVADIIAPGFVNYYFQAKREEQEEEADEEHQMLEEFDDDAANSDDDNVDVDD